MILLVDDDDEVRETSADMLGELGYVVIQASNAIDALAILDQRPELQVMVTDIRRQNLKVILMSGYFTPQIIKRRFLQKPFRTHELDQAIQAELCGS
jgi:CheY-like chemotaxis protein